MSLTALIGSAVGALILGIAGRFVFYLWGRSRDREAELRQRVEDLEYQLKVEKDAPQTPDELADRLRTRGM